MIFKDSELAHKYCIGKGIEIGAAAHNPFHLTDCINVACVDDYEFYKKHQLEMCDSFAKVDYFTTAEYLTFAENDSHDYIISSHVVEHLQNLIGTFLEWKRVLKNGGIVFIIFPKRNALNEDIGRKLSTIEEFVDAYKNPIADFDSTKHFWVFDLHVMFALIAYCNFHYKLGFEIIEAHETDDKVSNGHNIIMQVVK